MKVQLEKTFALPGPAEAAWAVLQDIEAVASCMPGAKITERIGEQQYKGTVAVKFGPASLSFRGEVKVEAVDAAARTLRLIGKGTDTTGSSAAAMDLTARIEAIDAATSSLVGASEVSMSGKAATFGGRMANAVADQVLQQFAGNFAARVQAAQQAQAPAEAGATEAAVAPVPAAPSQLNALALLWGIVKTWWRSLFGGTKA